MISALKKSAFVKDVSTLSSGIIVANVLTIAASLFLTRLYTPQEIGYLTFFNSSAIVLANIFTLGYELAVVTPKKNKIAVKIIYGTFYLLLGFSIILFLIIGTLLIIDKAPQLGMPASWLIFLPAGVFLLGCINIAQEWFNRTRNYTLLSGAKVVQSLFTALPQILIGFFFLNKIGLLIGFLSGRLLSSVLFAWNYIKNKLNTSIPLSDIIRTLAEFKRYPKYISPTLIIDRLSLEAPYFLISLFFAESMLGYFSISYRVLSVPLSFLGTAIGQVFFKFLASKKHDQEKLAPSLIKTWLYLSLIGIIPMGVILAGGPTLFEFVFGEGWGFSGTLAVLLVPMLYLDFISSPTGRSFLVLGLEHYSPIFSVARIIYVAGSLYIGYLNESIVLAILILSLSRTIALIIQNVILFVKAKQHDSGY